MFKNTQKEYIEYLETQMNYFKRFDRDMYIHYRNKLHKVLNTNWIRLNSDNIYEFKLIKIIN